MVKNKVKKRVGRGPSSGKGKTCGRGQKGQNARGSVRPGFEGGQMPLYRRVARRGFSNTVFKVRERRLSLSLLSAIFSSGDEVNPIILHDKGLLGRKDDSVKILSNGSLEFPLKIQGISCSQAAKEAIVNAGGQVEEGVSRG